MTSTSIPLCKPREDRRAADATITWTRRLGRLAALRRDPIDVSTPRADGPRPFC